MEVELSQQDKKLLKIFSMYLQSYGQAVASRDVRVESDSTYHVSTWYENDWRGTSSSISIPELEQMTELLERIFDKYSEILLQDFDEGDYGDISCFVDTKQKKLYFEAYINRSASTGHEIIYDFADVTNTESIEFLNEISQDNDYGTVSYEGGGDDGYIQDDIDLNKTGSISIPKGLESWLYHCLEYFGGWEINEGSSGRFYFNFKKKIVVHDHNEYFTDNITEPISLEFSF